MQIDRQLVARVVAGDARAEEIFYNAMRPQLLRASRYFLGFNDGDSEDVVQETFVVALSKLKDYTFEAPIYAWLREICLRRCYGRMRARKRLMTSVEQDLEMFMIDLSVQKSQKEAADLHQEERLALLRQIKKKLSPDSRKIVELKYVRGMSYAKISQYLVIPLGTVMSRLARARDQMRVLAEVADDEQYA